MSSKTTRRQDDKTTRRQDKWQSAGAVSDSCCRKCGACGTRFFASWHAGGSAGTYSWPPLLTAGRSAHEEGWPARRDMAATAPSPDVIRIRPLRRGACGSCRVRDPLSQWGGGSARETPSRGEPEVECTSLLDPLPLLLGPCFLCPTPPPPPKSPAKETIPHLLEGRYPCRVLALNGQLPQRSVTGRLGGWHWRSRGGVFPEMKQQRKGRALEPLGAPEPLGLRASPITVQ